MIKNIKVVDEFGKNYGETYLKRAKQLEKKGRAHFVDDKTIQLVCPPKNLEENMEERKVTQSYILDKIDQITNDTNYIKQAIEEIKNIPESKGPGDMGASAKADAIAQVIKARETTNQKILTLLNGIYHTIDDYDVKKQASKKLLEYVDDPEAFQNVKEAIELIK